MIPLAKLFSFVTVCLAAAGSGFGQGQIILDNRVSGAVVAPIYGSEPAAPELSKHGNTSSGVPVGTQVYGGALLAGSNYAAQLFAGPTNRTAENLTATQPSVGFGIGARAGFVLAPNFAVTVPGVADGEPALL